MQKHPNTTHPDEIPSLAVNLLMQSSLSPYDNNTGGSHSITQVTENQYYHILVPGSYPHHSSDEATDGIRPMSACDSPSFVINLHNKGSTICKLWFSYGSSPSQFKGCLLMTTIFLAYYRGKH